MAQQPPPLLPRPLWLLPLLPPLALLLALLLPLPLPLLLLLLLLPS